MLLFMWVLHPGRKIKTSETISDSAECNYGSDAVVTYVLTHADLSLGSQLDLFPLQNMSRQKLDKT